MTLFDHVDNPYIPVLAAADRRHYPFAGLPCGRRMQDEQLLADQAAFDVDAIHPDAIGTTSESTTPCMSEAKRPRADSYYGRKIDWFMHLIPSSMPVFWTNLPAPDRAVAAAQRVAWPSTRRSGRRVPVGRTRSWSTGPKSPTATRSISSIPTASPTSTTTTRLVVFGPRRGRNEGRRHAVGGDLISASAGPTANHAWKRSPGATIGVLRRPSACRSSRSSVRSPRSCPVGTKSSARTDRSGLKRRSSIRVRPRRARNRRLDPSR